MKLKFLATAVCLVLASSSLLANPQVFDLTWSGDTNFISTYLGSGSVSGATATGQLTLDTSFLVPAPSTPGAPNGSYLLSANTASILSLTITISGAGSGNGTFTLADFTAESGSLIFDTLNTPLSSFDLSQNLIGQTLSTGAAFGVLYPVGYPNPPAGDLVFSAGTAPFTNPNIPTKSDYPFLMLTAGGSGDYLQLTSIIAVPEPGNALTGILTLALCAGLLVRTVRLKAASR